jgi:hypothetical protein
MEWSAEQLESNDQGAQLDTRLLALLRASIGHDAVSTFAVLTTTCRCRELWTADEESYHALAESLSEPSEWRAHMDSLDPRRLAQYLRDAMLAYADERN